MLVIVLGLCWGCVEAEILGALPAPHTLYTPFVFYFEHFPHPIPISKLITFHPITHQQNATHLPFDFHQGHLPFCGVLFYSENQPTSSYASDKPRLYTSTTSSISLSKTSLSTTPLS
jgi:hypothetical protein